MKKIFFFINTFAFLGILIFFGFKFIVTPEQKISKIENRDLKTLPVFSWKSLANGEYFKSFEGYVMDQFPYRQQFVSYYQKQETSPLFNLPLYLVLDQNKTGNGTKIHDFYQTNGVLVINNEWLLVDLKTRAKRKDIDQALNELNKLATLTKENNIETFLAFAPNKNFSLEHLYPSTHNFPEKKDDRKYFLENVPDSIHTINLLQHFKTISDKDRESLYFKTDHHWNMDGAFIGYQEIIKNVNQHSKFLKTPPLSINEIDVIPKKDGEFKGSYNRLIHYLVDAKQDQSNFYKPIQPFSLKISEPQSMKFDDFYGKGLKEKTFDYGTLYATDYGKIKILNTNTESRKKLLLLKDSYADAIIPFLAQHFYETTVIDSRVYVTKSVLQEIKENKYDMAIILHNDTNIFGPSYDFDLTYKRVQQ